MKRLILISLLVVFLIPFVSCGQEGRDAGELCASDEDCASGTCGFGPCPASGPPCPQGEPCSCLVCL